MTRISIGISTCPNDTFAFFPLVENRIDTEGLEFHFEFLDVQQLNEGLLQQRWDVAKASFHAALLVADTYQVFRSGSALGFGNGPLLLASRPGSPDQWNADDQQQTGRSTPKILCPGQHTTAALLYRLFYPNCGTIQHAVFSEIMPALESQTADFGVCIHEGRFTYQQQGLYCVEDLGHRWEKETQQPLPLGGILGNTKLGHETLKKVDRCITRSLNYATHHRHQAIHLMQQHAQELDDAVIWQHVDLYVNDWTMELGPTGTQALELLSEKAVLTGLTPNATRLTVVSQ